MAKGTVSPASEKNTFESSRKHSAGPGVEAILEFHQKCGHDHEHGHDADDSGEGAGGGAQGRGSRA